MNRILPEFLDAVSRTAQVYPAELLRFVGRLAGELRVTGTAHPVEDYLREYEVELPPAQLQMTPQTRARGPKPGAG